MKFSVYDKKETLKYILVFIAIIIVVVFYALSQRLTSVIEAEEKYKVELWAEATREISLIDINTDITFLQKVIGGNTTIPVILADTSYNVLSYRNLPLQNYSSEDLKLLAKDFALKNNPIVIDMPSGDRQYICYDDSFLLKALTYVPIIMLMVLVVFLICVVVLILTIKQSEQNRLWVGLFKETAHQLGTPTSSLMAWTEILKSKYPNDELIPELDKDTMRLKTIVERFSQIGSKAELEVANVSEVVSEVVNYMRNRISRQVEIQTNIPNEAFAMLNISLFEWVVENLCKNAVDAMEGRGKLTVELTETPSLVVIDITDTGKGISKSNISKVFNMGFTTKKRGWGLGLSLSRRIICEYHKGKIYVKHSQVDKGTTFTIEIKKM
ncbi:MAG: HAMP domain-containing histidine kinase [Paludibacteraceae bacterium]|nr:HAMP domain-containing histidine kinase [Paludibacteraceae bacterium]MBR6686385.1 HAMP domain-containing histidine kinase [Paludibacteraceae bacterium]